MVIGLTNNKTLHLILPYNLNIQRIPYPVIEFKSPTTSRHDAQLRRAIELMVLCAQLAHELDA